MENWLNKYNAQLPSAQKGKTVPQQKNTYADSLRLYNQGQLNIKKVFGKTPHRVVKFEDPDNDLKYFNLPEYREFKKTGILPVVEHIGVVPGHEKNKNYTSSYAYGYKKPTGPKKENKPAPAAKRTVKKPSAKSINSELEPIGIDTNFELKATIPESIPVPVRQPKYYKIIDTNNQKFGGGESEYQVEDLNELRELPKELWDRKILPQYDKGGAIKDDRGQWAHPGKVTEIGSNFITMKNVPYPVLGISDAGDTKIMYPEEDYEFIGNKVTEYPMAKNGKNLPNFTWLSKYE